MDKNSLIRAFGYNIENDESKVVINMPSVKPVSNPLDKLVYSENRFGWADNDIDVQNTTSNMEVKNALERRNVLRPAPNGTKDDDVAIDTVPRVGESVESYSERMTEFMDEYEQEVTKNE